MAAPKKTTAELDALAIKLRLTAQERSVADAYALQIAAAGGPVKGAITAAGRAANVGGDPQFLRIATWRILQRHHVIEYLAALTEEARAIVKRRTGVAVMETAEVLERLSEQARGFRPTKVVRERQRPKRKPKVEIVEATSEALVTVADERPEMERREYDMLGALRDLGEINGLYKQDAPPPPPSHTHETWVVFLKGLPKDTLREMHRQMFTLGLGEGGDQGGGGEPGGNGGNGHH